MEEVKKVPNTFPTQFKNLPEPRCNPTCYLKCQDTENLRTSQSLN